MASLRPWARSISKEFFCSNGSRLVTRVFAAANDNYGYLCRWHAGVEKGAETRTWAVDTPDPDALVHELKILRWDDAKLSAILTTHGHPDHVLGHEKLKADGLLEDDAIIVASPVSKVPLMNCDGSPENAERIREKTGVNVECLDVPGHCQGHYAFHLPDHKALFGGDVLFPLGCGRIFDGTPEELYHSIEKLKQLPDDTLVFAGHEYTLANAKFAQTVDPENEALKAKVKDLEILRGEGTPTSPTTIGVEKQFNPFMRLPPNLFSDVEVFTKLREMKDNF